MTGAAAGAEPQPVRRLFTADWIATGACGVALAYALMLAWQFIWNSSHLGSAGQGCRDFTWIWLSSKFAQSGALAPAYDYAIFSSAYPALFGTLHCVLEHLDYPPTLFFFTYPLGSMPYGIASAVWTAATLSLYLAAVYMIIPRPVAVIAALAPYPAFINILFGHNGFLTAGLIGLALASMEQRPSVAGICLGLLTYKPQFGMFFLFALIAGRYWRALALAAAASAILAVAAAAIFG
jgi:Glycosyltransferase family 87